MEQIFASFAKPHSDNQALEPRTSKKQLFIKNGGVKSIQTTTVQIYIEKLQKSQLLNKNKRIRSV